MGTGVWAASPLSHPARGSECSLLLIAATSLSLCMVLSLFLWVGRQTAHSSDPSQDTLFRCPHLVHADWVPGMGEGHVAPPHPCILGEVCALSSGGSPSNYVQMAQNSMTGAHTVPSQCWHCAWNSGLRVLSGEGCGIAAASGGGKWLPSRGRRSRLHFWLNQKPQPDFGFLADPTWSGKLSFPGPGCSSMIHEG